jgi:hypothetical protein
MPKDQSRAKTHTVALIMSSFYCKNNFSILFFSDADCGRGFTRLENFCVNISNVSGSAEKMLKNCVVIGATYLQSTTKDLLLLIRVNTVGIA